MISDVCTRACGRGKLNACANCILASLDWAMSMAGPSTSSQRSIASYMYFDRTTSNELEDSPDLSELAGQPTTKRHTQPLPALIIIELAGSTNLGRKLIPGFYLTERTSACSVHFVLGSTKYQGMVQVPG